MFGSLSLPERNVEEWLTTPLAVPGVELLHETPEALLLALTEVSCCVARRRQRTWGRRVDVAPETQVSSVSPDRVVGARSRGRRARRVGWLVRVA